MNLKNPKRFEIQEVHESGCECYSMTQLQVLEKCLLEIESSIETFKEVQHLKKYTGEIARLQKNGSTKTTRTLWGGFEFQILGVGGLPPFFFFSAIFLPRK